MANLERQTNRIVIVGGGFGGAYCAQALRKQLRGEKADVWLIDKHNYFVFYPLLVEAGTGSIEPRHAVVSLRSFLGNAIFRMADVTDVDVQRRRVHYRRCLDGKAGVVDYDYLVVSLGSVTNLPPVPGLREYAFGVKTMADAVALRDRGIQMLELADATEDENARRALLHFVVVGGNFTGVEVAGELATFLRQAARAYRNVSPEDISVTLVELTDRILRALGEDLSSFAVHAMERCGIHVRLEDSVTRIEADHVQLQSGQSVGTHTVVWCAGIAPNPLIEHLPFPTDERGYVLTGRDMRVVGYDRIWAIGDCAINPGPDNEPYPATAQHAIQQARHVAKDLGRVLRGLPTRPTQIASKGSIAAIGCRTGVAKVFGIRLSGFPAWWLYRTVYLLKMPGLARKLRLALDWTFDLVFPRDHVQLSVHRAPTESLRPTESATATCD